MAWLAFHKRQNTAAYNNVFTNPSLQIFCQCYNYHNYDVFSDKAWNMWQTGTLYVFKIYVFKIYAYNIKIEYKYVM